MAEQHPDSFQIMQIGTGFLASKTLLSAVELGVFTVLGAGPLPCAELRERLGLHPRGAADFLDALVALGLLDREGDGEASVYANTVDTGAYLDKASPTYIGSILAMASQRLYPSWGHLTEVLHTGRPHNEAQGEDENQLFAALYADPARLEAFIEAMAGVQLSNFIVLADRFDFSRFGTACDAGGASGALSIAIARRHPEIKCISFDLPQVTPLARRKIEAAGLAGRIEAVSGNFLAEDLPKADLVLMGNILRDWGTETKQRLIAKAYAALPAGGAFIAIENVIGNERRKNAFGLLMSLNMLVETPGGYDYTFAQFDGWCRAAGFRCTETIPLAGPASAAVAWK